MLRGTALGLLALAVVATAPTMASEDPVETLRERTRTDWLALTVADLGRAWWTLNNVAGTADDPLVLAVLVNGRTGYIDTTRLSAPAAPGVPETIPADLHQAWPGGNFAILVSGDPPPIRPRNNPLGWRGFVWEGFVPPDTPLSEVFDDVAVLTRSALRFDGADLRTAPARSASAAIASPSAGEPSTAPLPTDPSPTPATIATGTPSAPDAVAAAVPAPSAPRLPAAVQAPASDSAPDTRTPPGAAPAVPPRSSPTAQPTRLPRIDGKTRRRDDRLDRITQVNVTLRRQVAYMEALLLGPELGRDIPLETRVSDLVGIITGPNGKPHRNVFLRIATERGLRVGRVVTLNRYPLYRIGTAGRGSHSVLMDLEVRGPDGTTLLGGDSETPVTVPTGPVQYRGVTASTTLAALGVRAAVWWPVRGQLGQP